MRHLTKASKNYGWVRAEGFLFDFDGQVAADTLPSKPPLSGGLEVFALEKI